MLRQVPHGIMASMLGSQNQWSLETKIASSCHGRSTFRGQVLHTDFASAALTEIVLRRKSRVPAQYRTEDYTHHFDAETLWVDAIHSGDRVVLICPRLNNLRASLQSADFYLDGRSANARVREFKRHAIVELRTHGRPSRVSVDFGQGRLESRINLATPEIFHGRNVILATAPTSRFSSTRHPTSAADNRAIPTSVGITLRSTQPT
jgi:hypothetical protein